MVRNESILLICFACFHYFVVTITWTLSLLYRNHQPLQSRGYVPIYAGIANVLGVTSLLFRFESIMTYCWINFGAAYPMLIGIWGLVLVMWIRNVLLHRLYRLRHRIASAIAAKKQIHPAHEDDVYDGDEVSMDFLSPRIKNEENKNENVENENQEEEIIHHNRSSSLELSSPDLLIEDNSENNYNSNNSNNLKRNNNNKNDDDEVEDISIWSSPENDLNNETGKPDWLILFELSLLVPGLLYQVVTHLLEKPKHYSSKKEKQKKNDNQQNEIKQRNETLYNSLLQHIVLEYFSCESVKQINETINDEIRLASRMVSGSIRNWVILFTIDPKREISKLDEQITSIVHELIALIYIYQRQSNALNQSRNKLLERDKQFKERMTADLTHLDSNDTTWLKHYVSNQYKSLFEEYHRNKNHTLETNSMIRKQLEYFYPLYCRLHKITSHKTTGSKSIDYLYRDVRNIRSEKIFSNEKNIRRQYSNQKKSSNIEIYQLYNTHFEIIFSLNTPSQDIPLWSKESILRSRASAAASSSFRRLAQKKKEQSMSSTRNQNEDETEKDDREHYMVTRIKEWIDYIHVDDLTASDIASYILAQQEWNLNNSTSNYLSSNEIDYLNPSLSFQDAVAEYELSENI
eukprot:gb/GECH01008403.1/.p1 GENE.gb/GECH01008403.1/~~gb/GECH01008403.1/.p1  ORF type:complete len:632 (+),score=184.99 gb/GECH01008403.1/:1-1896(+)